MNPPIALSTFLRKVFYNTCFCIGLGTVSYYSYAQLQTWNDPVIHSNQVSSLQAKVNALGINDLIREDMRTTVMAVEEVSPKTEASNGKFTVASRSPLEISPAPAGTDVKLTDVKLTDVKPEGEALVAAAGTAPAATTTEGAVNEQGLPVVDTANPAELPPFQVQIQQQPQVDPNAISQALGAVAQGPAVAPESTTGSGVGGVPTPKPKPSSSSSSQIGGGTTNSIHVGTIASAGPAIQTLSSGDLHLLSFPIKASFLDQTQSVAGLVCSIGNQENSVSDCIRNNHYSVHTQRWNTTFGLSNDATISIHADEGSTQVKLNLVLKLQDISHNAKDLAVEVHSNEMVPQNETRNGKSYKIYHLKFPDITVSTGEKINGLQAVLVYEESKGPSESGFLAPESTLTFSRVHVQTTSSAWDITGTNRAPAANDQVIIADTINYSMSLEKSP